MTVVSTRFMRLKLALYKVWTCFRQMNKKNFYQQKHRLIVDWAYNRHCEPNCKLCLNYICCNFVAASSRLATLQLCLGVTKPGFQAYFPSYIWNFRDLRRQTSQSSFSLAAGSVVLVAHQNSFMGSLWQDFLQAGQPLQLLLPSFLSHWLCTLMTELLLGIWWLRESEELPNFNHGFIWNFSVEKLSCIHMICLLCMRKYSQ